MEQHGAPPRRCRRPRDVDHHAPQGLGGLGHVAGFTDPLVDCKVSKQRYRADQLFFAKVVVDGNTVGYVSALESEKTAEDLQSAAETLKRKKAIQGALAPVQPKDFTEAQPDEFALIPSPAAGEHGSLTAPRSFNMMYQRTSAP